MIKITFNDLINRMNQDLARTEENIGKVICSISRFKYANIFVGTFRKPIKLSKKLQKECDIKLKIVDDPKKFEEIDIISFAENDKENKEIL